MNTTQQLEAEIDAYFASVSPQQLAADMSAADFAFYNKVGRKLFLKHAFRAIPVYAPPAAAVSHASCVMAPTAGKTDELPLAA